MGSNRQRAVFRRDGNPFAPRPGLFRTRSGWRGDQRIPGAPVFPGSKSDRAELPSHLVKASYGVVANAWRRSYDEPAAGEIYIYYGKYMFGTFLSTIVVRTSGDPLAMANTLRQQVWAVDPNEPIVKIETMDDIIAGSIWRPRFSAWIFAALGGWRCCSRPRYLRCSRIHHSAAIERGRHSRSARGDTTQYRCRGYERRDRSLAVGLVTGAIASLLLSRWWRACSMRPVTTRFTYLARQRFCSVSGSSRACARRCAPPPLTRCTRYARNSNRGMLA